MTGGKHVADELFPVYDSIRVLGKKSSVIVKVAG